MFGAAFAQGEQLPNDLLGFSQDQGGAGLQLGVAFLEGRISRPELGNNGHIQELVSGQALQEGFKFICRSGERGRKEEREGGEQDRTGQLIHMSTTPFWSTANILHSLFYPSCHAYIITEELRGFMCH